MPCAEGELTLERLDYRRVGDQTAVVRLLARLSADLGAPRQAELIVTTGSDRGRYSARLCSTERRLLDHDADNDHALDSELLWRATFGLPLELVESPDALFALFALTSAGGMAVTLPAPELRGSHPRRLALAEPRLRIQPTRLVAGQARQRMALLATTVVVTTTASPAVAFADGGSSGPAGTSVAATGSAPAALVMPATTSSSGSATATTDATAPAVPATTTPTAPAATPGTATAPAATAPAATAATTAPAPATTTAAPATPAPAIPARPAPVAGASPVTRGTVSSSATSAPSVPAATAHVSSSSASPTIRPRALQAPVRIAATTTARHTAAPAHPAHPRVVHFFSAASHSANHRHHAHHRASVLPTCGRGAAAGPLAIAAGGHRPGAVTAPRPPASCTTSTAPDHRHAPVHHRGATTPPVTPHHGASHHGASHHAASSPAPAPQRGASPAAHHGSAPAADQGGSLSMGSQPGPVRTWPTGSGGGDATPRHHASGHHHAAHHPAARHHASGGAPLTGPTRPAPPAPVTPAPVTPAPSSGSTTSTTPAGGSARTPASVNPKSWTGSVSPNPSLTAPVTDLSGLAADANRPPSFLIPIYMEAGRRYDVPWTVLAAINSIESDYGRDLSTSTAGAVGWMQFEPSTWSEYGLAVDGHSVPNPYDPRDAIFSAARYLAAAGAAKDIATAVYAYNHAGWYVDEVLTRARAIAGTAQYERRTLRHGVFSISFATGVRQHPTVSYRGGMLSHYDRLIAAANMVSAADFPYLWGGGHTQPAHFGPFDCSGTVSYVLQQSGYAVPTSVSGDIGGWHFPTGPGAVTIFYNPTHTFMRIGNRFFGTSDARPGGGGGWIPVSRLPADYLAGFNEVHVPHLGLNSYTPQPQGLQRFVSTRPRKFAFASFSLGFLVLGAWKVGLTPF